MFRSAKRKNVRCNPKVQVHRNGTCTISGLPFDMAQYLANVAYNHSDSAVKAAAAQEAAERADTERMKMLEGMRPVVEANWASNRSWCAAAAQITRQLCNAFATAIRPLREEGVLSKDERWARLRNRRKLDAMFDAMLEEYRHTHGDNKI